MLSALLCVFWGEAVCPLPLSSTMLAASVARSSSEMLNSSNAGSSRSIRPDDRGGFGGAAVLGWRARRGLGWGGGGSLDWKQKGTKTMTADVGC